MASTIAQASIARPVVAVSAAQTKAVRSAATVMAAPVSSSASSAFIGAPVRAAVSASRRMPSSSVVVKAVAAPVVDWDKMATDMDNASPLQIMDEKTRFLTCINGTQALKAFGDDIAIAFSGAEDVALIEYAKLTGRKFRVFSLDTGRLNPETYQLFDAVEKHYGIRIEYTFPDTQECLDLVNAKGMYSFYEDGHQECCRVRKVRPLRRKLGTLNAWITGQRKDQSPGTRSEIPISQVDPVFEGLAGGDASLVKFNPLANVLSADVWTFLRTMEVPVNALHDKGFDSIGCEPCTRPVLPNQHEREGRWWWEDAAAKECGLHSGNIKDGDSAEDGSAAEDLWTSGVTALSKDDLEKMVATAPREKDTVAVLYAPWCQFCQGLEPDYSALAESMAGSKSVTIAKFQADTERDFAAATFGLETYPTIVLLPKTGGVIKYPSERRDVDTLQGWVRAMCGTE